MEDLIVNELKRKLKWGDRIWVLIFKKRCIKIYKIGIERGVNTML
jgi:hypothetical protein